jgi:PKD domain
MKHFISALILFTALGCNGQNICVSVDCKDTITYPQTSVTLNGIVTSSDGVKSVLWKVTSGTSVIANTTVDSTTATLSTSGTYVYLLTGTSLKGAVGTAFDTVIYVGNKPPVAVVGQSLASTNGTATLSGDKSTDPEGLPLTYKWSQLSGPTAAIIDSPTIANPSVSAMVTGTYVFKLTVTDSGGLSSSASQLVAVNLPVTIIKTVTTIVTYYSDGTTKTVVTTVP